MPKKLKPLIRGGIYSITNRKHKYVGRLEEVVKKKFHFTGEPGDTTGDFQFMENELLKADIEHLGSDWDEAFSNCLVESMEPKVGKKSYDKARTDGPVFHINLDENEFEFLRQAVKHAELGDVDDEEAQEGIQEKLNLLVKERPEEEYESPKPLKFPKKRLDVAANYDVDEDEEGHEKHIRIRVPEKVWKLRLDVNALTKRIEIIEERLSKSKAVPKRWNARRIKVGQTFTVPDWEEPGPYTRIDEGSYVSETEVETVWVVDQHHRVRGIEADTLVEPVDVDAEDDNTL